MHFPRRRGNFLFASDIREETEDHNIHYDQLHYDIHNRLSGVDRHAMQVGFTEPAISSRQPNANFGADHCIISGQA